jgi:hypothetical protein
VVGVLLRKSVERIVKRVHHVVGDFRVLVGREAVDFRFSAVVAFVDLVVFAAEEDRQRGGFGGTIDGEGAGDGNLGEAQLGLAEGSTEARRTEGGANREHLVDLCTRGEFSDVDCRLPFDD